MDNRYRKSIRILPRLVAMARNVAADSVLQVGFGVTSMYEPKRNRVTLSAEILEWSETEAVAVAAHEGGHAQLSFYPVQLSSRELGDPLRRYAANRLEDIRVNAWVGYHFSGLAEGLLAITERVGAVVHAGVAALGPEPRTTRFLEALRLRALGRPVTADNDPAVGAAVQTCLSAVVSALAQWPERWGADRDERWQASQKFVDMLREYVFPALDRLRALDREGREPVEAARLAEQEERAAEAFRESSALWQAWQAAKEDGELREMTSVPAAYHRRLGDIGALLAEFTRRLEGHLLPNAGTRSLGGFRSGSRLHVGKAMRLDAGFGDGRVFRRNVQPQVQRYRILVLADVSPNFSPRVGASPWWGFAGSNRG